MVHQRCPCETDTETGSLRPPTNYDTAEKQATVATLSNSSHNIHVSLFLTLNMYFSVEKNEALPSHLPASSPTCHVGLLLLHAITAKGCHSPTGSRTQQVRASHDVLMHCHGQPGFTAYYYTAPPGAKVSDVQFGRHVDFCQKKEKEKKKKEKKHGKKEKNVKKVKKGKKGGKKQRKKREKEKKGRKNEER